MNIVFVSFLFILFNACSGESNHNSRSYVITQSPLPTQEEEALPE